MKIIVCGSMSAATEMQIVGEELKTLGHEVILPAEIHKWTNDTVGMTNKEEKIHLDVFKNYFEEIKNGDIVFVVNTEKNEIKDYIGANSLIEMAFAYVLNKKIYLLNNIPQMQYTDEIEALRPICLKGNLSNFLNN